MDQKLADVLLIAGVLLALIVVSSKLRKEHFGGALPGVVAPVGQIILEEGAVGTAGEVPCIVAGQPMANGFRQPNVVQSDIDLRSCVISTSIPDIAEACEDPQSSLHSQIVTDVKLVPSGDPQSLDCMVSFKPSLWDRTESDKAAIRSYNIANDWKLREELLQQANKTLQQQSLQLGQQVGTLSAINQGLEQNLLTTQSQLSTTQTQLQTTTGQLQGAQQQLNTTQTQLQGTQQQLNTTTLALNSAQSTIANTQNLLNLANESNSNLTASQQQAITQLQNELQNKMNQIGSLTALRDALQTELLKEKNLRQTVTNTSAALIAQLQHQLQTAQAQAAASGGPGIEYLQGLVIDVWHVNYIGNQFIFESRKFTSYGKKLLDLDILDFGLTTGWWSNDILLSNQIGFDIYGFIDIPQTKEYTFYIITDDGAQMWIDNMLLFDKWWATPSVRYEAKASLRAGKVPFRMRWYEWHGGKQLRVGWDGPGTPTMFADKLVNLITPSQYFYAKPSSVVTVPSPTVSDFRNWSRLNPNNSSKTPLLSNPPFLRTFDSTYCNNKNMTIVFWLQIHARHSNWRNILQVTKPNPNNNNLWFDGEHPGHRRPGIWIGPNASYLHICSSTGNNVNDWWNTADIHLNEKTLVVINYRERQMTTYLYNRHMKWENTKTYSADLWPAHGLGYNVYMGAPHAGFHWDCHNFALRNLRFYNVQLTKAEIMQMYVDERTMVNINDTAQSA